MIAKICEAISDGIERVFGNWIKNPITAKA
jgi:hypothetical protein